MVNPYTFICITLQGLVSASSNQGGLMREISIFTILQALQFCFQFFFKSLKKLLMVIKAITVNKIYS
ncbi:hypothetical protein BT93_D1576 [Corymbia citriodora subsp. variegata]|nr:hypothetical protein BT93_D1576 [Corymbia citriodora subsp. variegata]